METRSEIDNEQHSQEYWRFRDAEDQPALQTPNSPNYDLISPSYLTMKKQNKNEYSRYKDSQSLQKKASDTCDKIPSQLHQQCRFPLYYGDIMRFPVNDDKVSWDVPYVDYAPVEFTTDRIQRNTRADPSDPSKIDKFNQIDKKTDRRSFMGSYYVDPVTNRPRNPMGRTGITGRGRLYYWGPNHAGDSVITRWLRDENGSIVHRRSADSQDLLKPVLEFVTIQRKDTKEWGLPGGMVDPGEHVSQTVRREFEEEAMEDGIDEHYVNKLFANGYKLFESYADDPRNTDNAWIETVAINFHDDNGELTKHIHLHAGDDAEKVAWCSVDRNLALYGSHKDILKTVVDRLDAYW